MAVPARKFEYFIIEKLNLQKISHTAAFLIYVIFNDCLRQESQNMAVPARKFEYFIIEKLNLQKISHTAS